MCIWNFRGSYRSHRILMGMGSATLFSWGWGRAEEWLLGMGGKWQHNMFPFLTQRKLTETGITEKWPNLDICVSNLIFSYFIPKGFHFCEFSGYLFNDVYEIQQQVRWDTSMGLAAGGNGNNRLNCERNGNKTWLNMGAGMEMGMNSWEREGVGVKKTFLLTCTLRRARKEPYFWLLAMLTITEKCDACALSRCR